MTDYSKEMVRDMDFTPGHQHKLRSTPSPLFSTTEAWGRWLRKFTAEALLLR